MDAQGDYFWTRYFGGVHFDKCYRAIENCWRRFPDGWSGKAFPGKTPTSKIHTAPMTGGSLRWAVLETSFGPKRLVEVKLTLLMTSSLPRTVIFVVGDTRSNDQDVTQNKGNADVCLSKWVQPEISSGKNLWWGSIWFGKKILPISDNNYLIIGSCRSANGDATANKRQMMPGPS